MIEILNLYAGIGGNREHWPDICNITAVEIDEDIAKVYKKRYPGDEVIISDAAEYLVMNSEKFDFIWASPPCPTHSQCRYNLGCRAKGYSPVMPDMTSLYGTIVFLRHHFDGLWCVENVKPYYETLIDETVILQRHLFWTNYNVTYRDFPSAGVYTNRLVDYKEYKWLVNSKIKDKRKVLRNCVDAKVGEHVFRELVKAIKKEMRE